MRVSELIELLEEYLIDIGDVEVELSSCALPLGKDDVEAVNMGGLLDDDWVVQIG